MMRQDRFTEGDPGGHPVARPQGAPLAAGRRQFEDSFYQYAGHHGTNRGRQGDRRFWVRVCLVED